MVFMRDKLTIHTDGVGFIIYLFYAFACTYFCWFTTSYLVSARHYIFSPYGLSAVIFLMLILIGFFYFTSYILSNRIVVSSKGISCRYFGYRYSIRDYFLAPTISHSITWDQVFLVLSDSLKDLPKSFTFLSKADLRQRLFFPMNLPNIVGSCYGNLPSFLVVLKSGRSRLVYTEPFSRRSIAKVFSFISSKGVMVSGSFDSNHPALSLNQSKGDSYSA
jgi:hypothetical protein